MQDVGKKLMGDIGALYYSDLFSAIGAPHPTKRYDVPVSLVIGFKDLDPKGIRNLESTLQDYFGKDIPELVSVPGLYTAKIFKRNEIDHKRNTGDYQYPFRSDAVITEALLDVWLTTENAGWCSYIAGANNFHTEIERWNQPSSPNNRHVTLYVSSELQFGMFDRSPEWKKSMVALIDSLSQRMSDKEVMREVAKRDVPLIQRVRLLRQKDSIFLIKNFLPGYEIASPNGYPELVRKLK